MSNSSGTATRLAKNTAFMYIRMALLMIISLYSSRVLLRVLGVDDYGIYNLVGSIVAIFNSLRSLFSSSTQRFLNFEMGRKNIEKLKSIFSLSLFINLLLVVVFVCFAEALGAWFFATKINIDPTRFTAAKIVFHLSLFSASMSIISSSFDALIIAHEKMNYYAYMSIIEGGLKLGAIFLLPVFSLDKLILYGILIAIIPIFILSINVIYCRYQFCECKLSRDIDPGMAKNLLGFATWSFLGNTAYSLSQNGLNMVLNVFGGPIVNAARGVAFQVISATKHFISNIEIVIRPHCVKTFAEGKLEETFDIIFFTGKILFSVQLFLVIPLCYWAKDILTIWLGNVPEHSVPFLQIILITSLFQAIHPSIDLLFTSVGKIKKYQIVEGIVLSSPVILAIIILKCGVHVNFVFIISGVVEIINLYAISRVAHYDAGLDFKKYSRKVFLPCFLSMLPFLFFFIVVCNCNSMFLMIASTLLSYIVCFSIMFFIGFDSVDRNRIISIVRSFIKYSSSNRHKKLEELHNHSQGTLTTPSTNKSITE